MKATTGRAGDATPIEFVGELPARQMRERHHKGVEFFRLPVGLLAAELAEIPRVAEVHSPRSQQGLAASVG